jgi:surface antigen
VNGVLQHLPVAVRLLRLESAVRELGAQAGDMATGSELQQLSQQQAALSSQLAGVLAQVDGSVGMRQIDEQVASLAHSVAVSAASVFPTRRCFLA